MSKINFNQRLKIKKWESGDVNTQIHGQFLTMDLKNRTL